MKSAAGTVYLVGGGPGDPGLITVRGLSLLQQADVVVHDRLIGHELLAEARNDAEIIDVGKARGEHKKSQQQINDILVDRARRGMCVVRLKGGDPYIFGRGLEEVQACRAANVNCIVIPGVSSALAAPAAAGVSLTKRESVRAFAVLTGTVASNSQAPPLDFKALAQVDVLVVMMGLHNLGDLCGQLVAAGRDPDTHAACIASGTLRDQRVVKGTLATIADAAMHAELTAPVVTVIGEPASDAVSTWRSVAGPLAGRRIVLTRPRERSVELASVLSAAGASVIHCPMIRIDYPTEAAEADAAVKRIDQYRWIVFTSASGVEGFRRRLDALALDARVLNRVRIAAVGPATGDALHAMGLRADLIPEQHDGQALARTIIDQDNIDGARILHPRGDRALAEVVEQLTTAGATVDEPIVYRTVDADVDDRTAAILRDGVDGWVFASPSAVRRAAALNLVESDAVVACIGETTAGAAREIGLRVDVVPDSATSAALADAIVKHFAAQEAVK